MYTTERTMRVVHAPQEYRSASTTAYLKNQWLPVQPSVQREIRDALKAGLYDEDRSTLCADLQRDPATLFQCLKALPGFIPESQPLLDPLSALQDLPKAELVELLEKVLGERSVHRVGKGGSQQKEQLIRSILSSTAARTLSASVEAQGDELNAGVVAHLRNLGRLLVAWNYPRIFRRAVQTAKLELLQLDTAIERILGVAPQALGFSIAREWGLHTEILRCLAFDPAKEPAGAAAFQRCGHLCGISESYVDNVALADPAEKKSAQAEAIEDQLISLFGPESLSKLGTTISQTLQTVRQRIAPDRLKIQKPGFDTVGGLKIPRSNELEADARFRIQAFIKNHTDHSSVKEGLEEMISSLIPTLGFSNGCLYILDRSQTYLVPTVQVGERRPQGYSKVDVRKSGVIAESLFSGHPVVQEAAFLHGEVRPHVTGAAVLLGQDIVLSLSWKNRESLQGDPGALFQGIKACLESLGNAATLEKL